MAEEMSQNAALRVLEFYSGIGGMHYAAKGCGFNTEVLAALEINTTAIDVYTHNFCSTPVGNRNIEGLTQEYLDDLAADVYLMSPPCQPYTRVGRKAASSDPRANSFLHIMELLKRLSSPPTYILMENVKGFETSDTRDMFVETLTSTDYTFQEFLLSPIEFGVPNSRLRYYMLARRKPLGFQSCSKGKILDHIPSLPEDKRIQRHGQDNSCSCTQTCRTDPSSRDCNECCSSLTSDASGLTAKTNQGQCTCGCPKYRGKECNRLSHYLEMNRQKEYFHKFLLPDKVLSRFAMVLDIVTSSSTRSCCFTKAYGHYAEGTGSVLQTTDCENTAFFNKYKDLDPNLNDNERAAVLRPLGLRYFTPREVANLMCFPTTFDFPDSTTLKQQYRLLGNSLNVQVVTELLKYLFDSKS